METINTMEMVVEGFDPEILQLLMNTNNPAVDNTIIAEQPIGYISVDNNNNSFEELVNVSRETVKKKINANKYAATPPLVPKDAKESNEDVKLASGTNTFSEFIDGYLLNNFKLTLDKKELDYNINFDSEFSVRFEDNELIDIIVVGCGGNGSRLINLIAQQMYSNKRIKNLYLFDDDRVEPKNLSRQLFYEFEVGELKANALANRYNMLYGLNIKPINTKFDKNMKNVDLNTRNNLVIFDCVDNKAGREEIEYVFNEYLSGVSTQTIRKNDIVNFKSITVISCGNQKDYGQVHVGHASKELRSLGNLMLSESSNGTRYYNNIYNNVNVPRNDFNLTSRCLSSLCSGLAYCDNKKSKNIYLSPFLEYNKTFEDSKESVSCADMEIAEEQSMAINATVAQIAFNMFFEMLVSKDGLKNNMVFVNLSNDFNVRRCNTKESCVDYYINSIFGKNVFFEKESCLDQICRSYDAVKSIHYKVKADSSRIFNTINYSGDKIAYFIRNLISEKRRFNEKEVVDEFEACLSDYFDSALKNIDEFIVNNYSHNYSDHYIESGILIYTALDFMDVYFSKLHDYVYNLDYNMCYFYNSKISNKIANFSTKLLTSFYERYSDIASKSNYEYFIKR